LTTSITKQQIKQSWDLHKMQESATKMVAMQIGCRLHFIETHPGKEIEALEKHAAQHKAEMLKGCGVTSPLELVRHIAEFETNMFGATASIEGDDSRATLFNEKPTVWLEAKKLAKLSKEQEELMGQHYKQWMLNLAEAFGYKAQVELGADGNSSKITFSK
jgi:hypothetical protein